MSTQGERGERGTQGDQGNQGNQGNPGNQGNQGDRGDRGTSGDAGVAGQTGKTGKTGKSRLHGTQLAVYLGIILIVGIGFIKFEAADKESMAQRELLAQGQKESKAQRDFLCRTAKENREAIRQVYIDITELGVQVSDGSNPPERKAELMRILAQFEKERLAELPRLDPECGLS